MKFKTLQPGSTIGCIGGGQLARMMALEARRMGYRFVVVDPHPQSPAGQVCEGSIQGTFDNAEAAAQLARQCDVVTVDTEHVPADMLAELESLCPVYPSPQVMDTIQDRWHQRCFLAQHQLPQPQNHAVSSLSDLRQATEQTGFPCVLKTRRSGYDGKGQFKLQSANDCEAAWQAVGEQPCVLEAFVSFEREVSILLARNPQGDIAFYPVVHNAHQNHILHITTAPDPQGSENLQRQAEHIGRTIAEALDHVGMMAIELFVTAANDGSNSQQLLVNEIAPRPHNSGHFTFSACATSQFAQHVRAICGLGLGDTNLPHPTCMVNLLGDLWQNGEPNWEPILSHPHAQLHLYGKAEARPGRKMGHFLVSCAEPLPVAQQLFESL